MEAALLPLQKSNSPRPANGHTIATPSVTISAGTHDRQKCSFVVLALVEKPAWTSYYSLLQLAAGTNNERVVWGRFGSRMRSWKGVIDHGGACAFKDTQGAVTYWFPLVIYRCN
jgi:hypothetical protein